MARDYGEYVQWARWIRAEDERPDGLLKSDTVKRIYKRALPEECVGLTFDKKNRWRRTFPSPTTPAGLFCAVVGLAALDCPDEARAIATGAASMGAGHFDWSAPGVAYPQSGALQCYLRADVAE